MPRSAMRCICSRPVPGIGQQHLGQLVDARGGTLAFGGDEHRLEVSDIGADGVDLGGQHDLMRVADRPRVVALQEPAQALDDV